MATTTSRPAFSLPTSTPSRTSTDSDASSSSSSSGDLPFPKPLDRTNFLAPDFEPQSFLSHLAASRFQTLEDLRVELTQLSQAIQNELVDLVNDNYSEFLSLGAGLRGGEEMVEGVRVGVMGVEREIAGMRRRVEGEREKAVELLGELKELRREREVGRGLLEVDERISGLEEDLGLRTREKTEKGGRRKSLSLRGVSIEDEDEEEDVGDWGEEWDEDVRYSSDEADYVDDDNDEGGQSEKRYIPFRLRRRIEKFLMIKVLLQRYDPQHPFLAAQQSRVRKVKDTLLLDIDAAVRAQEDIKGKQAVLKSRAEVDE